MKSRERIRSVLNHEIPDRVPIDFGSMRSSGISTIAYNKLKQTLDITEDPAKMYDFIQQLAYPEKEIMDIFKVDVIDAGQAFLKSRDEWTEWVLDDGSKCLIPKFLNIEIDNKKTIFLKDKNNLILGKKPVTSLYVDQSFWVYKDLDLIPKDFKNNDLSKFIWAIPSPPWHLDIFNDKEFELFKSIIKNFYETTDYSIVLSVGCNMFETGTFLRGMENFLVDIYVDKKGVSRLLDKLVEENIKKLSKVIEGVGDYIDLLQFGDDLGSQDSSFMSPQIYRELFKSRHKTMWDYVHNNSKCKVFLHSCGSIYELLPDLIDAGLDVINPVQTTCRNMDPERLKKEFGKNLIFWGGCCNTRDVLSNKTPKEVEMDVKKRIEILDKNGGLVFNQIHNILSNVPPENVVAMFNAAFKYGQY
ncbi:MAG: methyltransferase [Cyanobacteria bacterium]|nr:methyltransferase [Cyanobacteriota bacterium]